MMNKPRKRWAEQTPPDEIIMRVLACIVAIVGTAMAIQVLTQAY